VKSPSSAAAILELRAGPGAAEQIRASGVSPADVACIPAAAGGPKGLALIPTDKLLYREWLRDGAPIELVGASVGAWRMAAMAQPDPIAALERLQYTYVRDQNYDAKPTPGDIAQACRRLATAVLDGASLQVRDGVSLTIVTSRARGALADKESMLAFGRAAMSNTISRRGLAAYLERVLFTAGPTFLSPPFDEFGSRVVPLDAANTEAALVASGSIPIVCSPVRGIPGAPAGCYWDGALVDYHLQLPYGRLTRSGARRRLVLYPHFNDFVTPGWLDKHLPWRRKARNHPWMDDVLLVAPSQAFLSTLPNGKLPDRKDFYRYGQDHAGRIRDWERAIAECERFAEALLAWLLRPDPSLLKPL
jgi:predicted acylesterase/phospholipase RssA